MLAFREEQLSMQTKTYFASKNIQLPLEWEQPNDQFADAFTDNEKSTNYELNIKLFQSVTQNWYHVESAKVQSEKYENYIDGICGAVCDSIHKWMKMASVCGVVINGPVGLLLPGCVVGPDITPIILASAPKNTYQEMKYSKAIAKAIGYCWQRWHLGLCGILSYPSFASFPGPVAPPTPNSPIVLEAFSSSGEYSLSPSILKKRMSENLADSKALHSQELFESISNAFYFVFSIFKKITLFQNILGTGPVPSFAATGAGPVIGGSVYPSSGILK